MLSNLDLIQTNLSQSIAGDILVEFYILRAFYKRVKSDVVYFSLTIQSHQIDNENNETDGVKHEIDGVNHDIDEANHVQWSSTLQSSHTN